MSFAQLLNFPFSQLHNFTTSHFLNFSTSQLPIFSTVTLDVIKGHPVPNTIFFTADDDIAEYFAKTLETGKFEQLSLLNDTFDFRFLNAKTLENFCHFQDVEGKEKVRRDPFIIIESIFINRQKE